MVPGPDGLCPPKGKYGESAAELPKVSTAEVTVEACPEAVADVVNWPNWLASMSEADEDVMAEVVGADDVLVLAILLKLFWKTW